MPRTDEEFIEDCLDFLSNRYLDHEVSFADKTGETLFRYFRFKIAFFRYFRFKIASKKENVVCNGSVTMCRSWGSNEIFQVSYHHSKVCPLHYYGHLGSETRRDIQQLKQNADKIKKFLRPEKLPGAEVKVQPYGLPKPQSSISETLDEFPETERMKIRQRRIPISYG